MVFAVQPHPPEDHPVSLEGWGAKVNRPRLGLVGEELVSWGFLFGHLFTFAALLLPLFLSPALTLLPKVVAFFEFVFDF